MRRRARARRRASSAAATSASATRPSGSIPATATIRSTGSPRSSPARMTRCSSSWRELYGAITSGGVFRAASIKAAEAAKVIENAQRDINIAFMNEVAQILSQDRRVGVGRARRRPDQVELPAVRARPGRRPLHRRRSLLSEPPRRSSSAITRRSSWPAARSTTAWARWIADALHERRRGKAGAGAGARPDLQGGRPRPAQQPRVRRRRAACASSATASTSPIRWPTRTSSRASMAWPRSSPTARAIDLVVGAVAHADYRELTATELEQLLEQDGTLGRSQGDVARPAAQPGDRPLVAVTATG